MISRIVLLRTLVVALILALLFAAGLAARFVSGLETAGAPRSAGMPLVLSPFVIALPILHAALDR